jgi:hypothetical protein
MVAAVLTGDDGGLSGAMSRSASVGFRASFSFGNWPFAGVPTGSGTGSRPSVDRTSSAPCTGVAILCTLATSVAKTAPSSALWTVRLPKLSTVWFGLPSSSAASVVCAEPASFSRMTNWPSSSLYGALFRRFFLFSLGDICGGSGATGVIPESSRMTISTSSSASQT